MHDPMLRYPHNGWVTCQGQPQGQQERERERGSEQLHAKQQPHAALCYQNKTIQRTKMETKRSYWPLLKNELHLRFIHDYIAISYLLEWNLFSFCRLSAEILKSQTQKQNHFCIYLIFGIAIEMSNKMSEDEDEDERKNRSSETYATKGIKLNWTTNVIQSG